MVLLHMWWYAVSRMTSIILRRVMTHAVMPGLRSEVSRSARAIAHWTESRMVVVAIGNYLATGVALLTERASMTTRATLVLVVGVTAMLTTVVDLLVPVAARGVVLFGRIHEARRRGRSVGGRRADVMPLGLCRMMRKGAMMALFWYNGRRMADVRATVACRSRF